MSISVQPNYRNYNPTFEGNKMKAVGKFMKNQKDHIIVQIGTQGISQLFITSFEPTSLLARKLGTDISEFIAYGKKISPKYQATNIFAWLMEGAKCINKGINKIVNK